MIGTTILLIVGFSFNAALKIKEKPTCPQVIEDPPIDILFPHESDCTKFYKCSHGIAHELDCPGDLLFNPEMDYCDWPHNVNCTNAQEEACPLLGDDPEDDIRFPHKTDCSKFYKCSHGIKHEMDCPEGLHFNPQTGDCDWPENANCKSENGNGNECPNVVEDPEKDILLPHESDCAKFYKCSHGDKYEFNCTSGLYFNSNTDQCDWPQNVNCTSEANTSIAGESFEESNENECPSTEEDPEEDVLFSHESDCPKFYKCSHGEKVEQNCPEGLHFNAKTKQCDWPENVNCTEPAFSNSKKSENREEQNACPSVEEDPEEDILLPHETDCSKFYKCSHGEKVELDCPSGLHFNPKTKKCDWPQNANCILNAALRRIFKLERHVHN